MRDWERFVEHTPWFVEGEVVVGAVSPWTREPVDELPVLSALLKGATVTSVTMDGRPYELLAWGPDDARRGWVCEPPTVEGAVHETHRRFWSVCGGIVERFAEPSGWWMNQDAVLTADAATTDVAGVLDDYRWAWEDEGLEIPIDPADFYAAAVEANGNLTLVNRQTGQLVLFAPDHAFPRVTPLPGCPEYSLMTIDDVPDLAAWIEESAAVWLD